LKGGEGPYAKRLSNVTTMFLRLNKYTSRMTFLLAGLVVKNQILSTENVARIHLSKTRVGSRR